MTLSKYIKKRDFSVTKEPDVKSPKGKSTKKKSKETLFVVQKHEASHLHYDFRLEVEGVLKSWAVPKGPSLNPADKRLAIEVEDHPYDYHDFEGTIPKGSYGGGTVMVWDEGTYEPIADLDEGYKKGDLKFTLHGSKLNGAFGLVRLKNQSGKNAQWLLIKKKDAYATEEDILDEDLSVITGRSMEEIAMGKKGKAKPKKKALSRSFERPSSGKDKMPHHIKPMLAKQVDDPFDSKEWLFETKWDGYRAIAEVKSGKVELYSRTFQSFNTHYEPIVEALMKFDRDAIFDGEIIVTDEKGFSSFQSLQNYRRQGSERGDIHYCIFDLLFYDGHDLRNNPLIERKQLLQQILKNEKGSILVYSEHVLHRGEEAFKKVEALSLEGIMAKKVSSTYHSTRSGDWLKIKTHARQEAIICGFTAPRGSRERFGALILGVQSGDGIRYIGHVGGGFDRKMLDEVMDKLIPLITPKSPFKTRIVTNSPVTWVKPKLVCEISFAEWTENEHVRQPIFLGLRFDKPMKEVKREKSIPIKEDEKMLTKSKSKADSDKEPPLTHLDKIYWPKEGITKGDLIDYYRAVSPFILPYLKDRPESLRRYPHGIDAESFFQKNIQDTMPGWIETFPIEHEGRTVNYLLIQDLKSLLFAVNLGCIDINPFNSRTDHVNNPDYLIIDLDPEKIPFEKVIETALEVHAVLEEVEVPHYVKTSGATGMHIYVPLGAKYSYDQAKEFAHLVGQIVHDRIPKFTSLERKPSQRQNAVYLDYLQNNFGQTVAAPYSVRPKSGAPVSTPLEWKEVKKGLEPTDFTIHNVMKRLKKKGDLFLPVLGKGIVMAPILKRIRSVFG